eukprot:COSAG01_NODE_49186_length_374_cov_1.094545_1_plen_52_part_00
MGVSKLEHLEENIKCCVEAAPLPAAILDAFDQVRNATVLLRRKQPSVGFFS